MQCYYYFLLKIIYYLQGPEREKVKDFENALAAAEDEMDVEATKTAKAEAAAELAEFDENIPIEEQAEEDISKAEQEVAQLMKQVKIFFVLVKFLDTLFIPSYHHIYILHFYFYNF